MTRSSEASHAVSARRNYAATTRNRVSLSLSLSLSAALAGSELSASSITIGSVGSSIVVTGIAGFEIENGISSFDFTVTLKQFRGGTLIATHVDQTTSSSSQTECETGCKSQCGGSCARTILNGFIASGTCGPGPNCSPSSTKLCNCFHNIAYPSTLLVPGFDVQIGDVFTFAINPGTGITDTNSNNNSISTTY
jgi:hypothetical protein